MSWGEVQKGRKKKGNHLLPHWRVPIGKKEEVKSLFHDENFDNIISKVKSMGKIFAITRGANGATIAFKDNIENIGPEKIKNLVDTTGAGDLFAAGFLEYFIQNQDLKKCGIRGVEMASKVIQQYGARL